MMKSKKKERVSQEIKEAYKTICLNIQVNITYNMILIDFKPKSLKKQINTNNGKTLDFIPEPKNSYNHSFFLSMFIL